ncbi:MAG: TonB-dependent receptor [Breznakibacter sp.]
MDNVVVSKTFTPDMPADFTGGSVQVHTIAVPDKKFLGFTIGTGFNTQSTGKDFYSNTRYKEDYLLGTDQRDWFKNGWANEYKAVYVEPENTSYQPTPEMNAVAAKIPNHWGLRRFTGAPTQSYSLSAGIPFLFRGGHSLGVVAALTYRHDENREDYDWRSRYSPEVAYDGIKNTFSTSTAGVLNMGWKNTANRINWKNLYNRRFTHDNARQTEYEPGSDSTLYNYYTRKVVSSPRTNTLWQTRLDGEHRLWHNQLTLTWFGDYNELDRSQPDDRFNQGYVASTLPDGREAIAWYAGTTTSPSKFDEGGLFASELGETKWNAGGNLEYSFTIAGNKQKLKTGYWGAFRNADYRQISTYVYAIETYGQDLTAHPLQEFYAPEHFASGDLYFKILRMGIGDLFGGDNYTGSQDIHAIYLMGDFRMLKERLQVSGGMRTEDSRMEVNTITRINASLWIDTVMVYRERRWLPALNIGYDILSSLKARVSYGRTLARPDFRERSAFQYYDLWERATIRGNGGLEDSFIDNYDLRLEWYPSSNEIVSISAFYKDFTKPVEIVTMGTNGEDMVMYVNMVSAEVKGLELNLRKHFGFVSPSLQRLFLTGNATLLEGNVRFNGSEIDGIYTIYGGYRNRPPMGLSPLVWNAGLGWEDDVCGAAVNYGYTGRKIRYAGGNEFLDEYEAPRSTLDAQVSARLVKGKMEIKLNASDLLAEPYIIYRNAWKYENGSLEQLLDGTWDYEKDKDTALRKSRRGTTFSASVSWKF